MGFRTWALAWVPTTINLIVLAGINLIMSRLLGLSIDMAMMIAITALFETYHSGLRVQKEATARD